MFTLSRFNGHREAAKYTKKVKKRTHKKLCGFRAFAIKKQKNGYGWETNLLKTVKDRIVT
jgi:hypothetical protein